MASTAQPGVAAACLRSGSQASTPDSRASASQEHSSHPLLSARPSILLLSARASSGQPAWTSLARSHSEAPRGPLLGQQACRLSQSCPVFAWFPPTPRRGKEPQGFQLSPVSLAPGAAPSMWEEPHQCFLGCGCVCARGSVCVCVCVHTHILGRATPQDGQWRRQAHGPGSTQCGGCGH